MNETAAPAHAALMDSVYRGQKYIYDATRKHYLLGRDELIGALAPPAGGTVLELGCGTGRNLILAARRWPSAHYTGLDISREMLGIARAKVDRAGQRGKIALVEGNAERPAIRSNRADGKFDRIFLSFALSMIPDWKQVIISALDLLAEDGELHIVDFGQCERLPGWFGAVLNAWLAHFHVAPRGDLRDFVSQLGQELGVITQFHAHYRDYSWRFVLKS